MFSDLRYSYCTYRALQAYFFLTFVNYLPQSPFFLFFLNFYHLIFALFELQLVAAGKACRQKVSKIHLFPVLSEKEKLSLEYFVCCLPWNWFNEQTGKVWTIITQGPIACLLNLHIWIVDYDDETVKSSCRNCWSCNSIHVWLKLPAWACFALQ